MAAGMAAVVVSALVLPGCGKLKGQFGFRTMIDDRYQKVAGVPEFKKSDRVDWVYVFNAVKGPHVIGVFVMKKELVWVEMVKDTRQVRPGNNILYGTIENYDEGRYKILLTENNSPVDEKEFIVYDSEEDTQ